MTSAAPLAPWMAGMQEMLDDPKMPDHIRVPAFRDAVEACARVKWECRRLAALLAEIDAAAAPEAAARLAESLRKMEVLLHRELHGLGLEQAGYARIARDLGLGKRDERS